MYNNILQPCMYNNVCTTIYTAMYVQQYMYINVSTTIYVQQCMYSNVCIVSNGERGGKKRLRSCSRVFLIRLLAIRIYPIWRHHSHNPLPPPPPPPRWTKAYCHLVRIKEMEVQTDTPYDFKAHCLLNSTTCITINKLCISYRILYIYLL